MADASAEVSPRELSPETFLAVAGLERMSERGAVVSDEEGERQRASRGEPRQPPTVESQEDEAGNQDQDVCRPHEKGDSEGEPGGRRPAR
jgi:hypothetical protein